MKALIPILLLVALLSIAAVDSATTQTNKSNMKRASVCPRDCICTPADNPTKATCNRLEIGTQIFGSDITDLVVENVVSKYPMTLTGMIFKNLGLSDLANVRISNSGLTEVDQKAFSDMSSLYSVNLTGNRISYLDPYTFETNKEMYLLSLSNNPSLFSKVKEFFLYSSTIQELDVSRCGIATLPSTTFSKMRGLMYINLSGNKIKVLDSDVFADLSNLEEIDLSDNLMQTIPADLFTLNGEMATLSIKNNPLTSIAGLNIQELLSLDVSNGNLKSIGPSTFEGMKYISNLALNGNGIEKIFSLGFSKLPDLAYLDLSNNKLDYISNQVIKENVNLDVFKISNNTMLKKLPSQGFESNNVNFTIHLFDASGCSLEFIADNTFKTMPTLAQLFLSRNKISTVGSSLHHLQHLIELDLSNNLIETLDKNTFSRNGYLRKLNIAGNPLMSISMNIFAKNSLTSLDVSSCQLYKLWEHAEGDLTDGLIKLNYLNASNNQLQIVDVKDLNMIEHLSTLDISNNPLQCDDTFQNLMTWLGETKVSPERQDTFIANLKMSPRVNQDHLRWQSLAKEVCGKKLDILPIDKNETDLLYNYEIDDNGEADNLIASKDLLSNYEIDDNSELDDDDDDDDDDSEEDTDYYYDTTEAKVEVVKKDPKPTVEVSTPNSKIDVITKDQPLADLELESHTSQLYESDADVSDYKNKLDEKPKLFENYDEFKNALGNIDFNFNETKNNSSLYDYSNITNVWRVGLLVITFILLCMVIRMCRRKNNLRDKCAVITVTGSHGRVKTDCGLVYQQLSEDLNCPKTPIIRKHGLVSNLARGLDETKGLKSQSNIPEAV